MRDMGKAADPTKGGRVEPSATAVVEAGAPDARTPAPPYALPPTDVLAALQVAPDEGLDENQVRARQAAFGGNTLDLQPPKSAAAILLHQIQSSVVALLAAAAALAGAFGDWQEAFAILVVLGLNTADRLRHRAQGRALHGGAAPDRHAPAARAPRAAAC